MKSIPQQASGEQLYSLESFLHSPSKCKDVIFFLKSVIHLDSYTRYHRRKYYSLILNILGLETYNRLLKISKRQEQLMTLAVLYFNT